MEGEAEGSEGRGLVNDLGDSVGEPIEREGEPEDAVDAEEAGGRGFGKDGRDLTTVGEEGFVAIEGCIEGCIEVFPAAVVSDVILTGATGTGAEIATGVVEGGPLFTTGACGKTLSGVTDDKAVVSTAGADEGILVNEGSKISS